MLYTPINEALAPDLMMFKYCYYSFTCKYDCHLDCATYKLVKGMAVHSIPWQTCLPWHDGIISISKGNIQPLCSCCPLY